MIQQIGIIIQRALFLREHIIYFILRIYNLKKNKHILSYSV